MFWLGVVIDCNYTIKIVCMVWYDRACLLLCVCWRHITLNVHCTFYSPPEGKIFLIDLFSSTRFERKIKWPQTMNPTNRYFWKKSSFTVKIITCLVLFLKVACPTEIAGYYWVKRLSGKNIFTVPGSNALIMDAAGFVLQYLNLW